MRALVLYVIFVAIGAVAAALIGLVVEREISAAVSLLVFLALFFANFYGAWVVTRLIMDRTFAESSEGTVEG